MKIKTNVTFDNLDETLIPVDIWLQDLRKGEDFDIGYRFIFTCSTYCPRTQEIHDEAIQAVAVDREELEDVIKNKIIPIYRAAINKLVLITLGTNDHMYYWE